ncbi:ribbon-helix-helix domain-containing protein [uncultured Tyzzerella sp.]|uniref:ribbon-helix-helix domain-containing protein n=1 Tax=uncultured Tyzzerella sp. TaxID=2321398 RepID=UPI00294284AA|nr:ribbon-helix-helix domain-containing protein [uncultured Tyzzerella sp.]
MQNFKPINITFSDEDLKYIDKIKKEKGLRSRSESLRLIIDEHKNAHDVTVKNLYEFMAEKIADILKPQLNSLKHSSNKTNEEVQVITELMNGLYVHNQLPSLIPDSKSKPHGALTNSKANVKERILKQAYIKNNRVD